MVHLRSSAERVLAGGLVTVVIGGALSPFVMIGLLGCLLLLIGLAALVLGAVLVAIQHRTEFHARAVLGVVLLWAAAMGLIVTTFGICEIVMGVPAQALRIVPADSGIPDWLVYLVSTLLLAALFACGLSLATTLTATRCAGWAFAYVVVAPTAAMVSYLLSMLPYFDLSA